MPFARLLGTLITCSIALFATVANADSPIRLGVFPYVTPVQLVKFHNPLRAKLEQVTGLPVTLLTAPSFKEFMLRTQRGDYDYVLTAPHMGRLAEYRDGYRAIAKTGHVVQGVYLVPKDSPIRRIEDLRGKRLIMGSRAAVICQLALKQLNEAGFKEGVDIEIVHTRTHNNAMYAPLRGEADAALTGELLFRKAGGKDSDKVRIIGETGTAPGFLMLAAERRPAAEVAQVQAGLLAFAASPDGPGYFKLTGFKAFQAVTEQEMAALQPFIAPFLKE